MRITAFFLSILLISVNICTAGNRPPMAPDGNGRDMQVFAPDPNKTIKVANNYSAMLDLTSTIAISLYNPSTSGCVVRMLPSNSKGTIPARTVAAGDEYSRGVLKAATFFNYSGCNNAIIERQ